MQFKWRHIDPRIEKRLDAVLRSWIGTPFMAGQRAKGIGVDCVQLVAGVMDELFRNPTSTFIPRLAPDSGIHSIKAGFKTVKAIRQGFTSALVRDNCIEPGDVIVVRATGLSCGPRRMGHVGIAGATSLSVIHSSATVCKTSMALVEILRIYRPLDKDRWI